MSNKITITDTDQNNTYTIKTEANMVSRILKCCCKGYQLQEVIIVKDTGIFAIGDTINLEIKTRSVLSPFKYNYELSYVIEKDKYLYIRLSKLIPFRAVFYHQSRTKRQLQCI